MTTWQADDGNAQVEIEAETAREAAEEYVADGDWGDAETTRGAVATRWVTVRVWREVDGEREDEDSHCVEIEPTEPECEPESILGPDGERIPAGAPPAHDWGEDRNSPTGHGGGVIIRETCTRCGCRRKIDTWAQRPDTGEQGLTSVSYPAREVGGRMTTTTQAERERDYQIHDRAMTGDS